MSTSATIEQVYSSLQNNNDGLDVLIARLKAECGGKPVTFDPKRLAQGNRQGRKLMQAYFRQRGVTVQFAEEK
jgi:hypothetical protein